MKLKLLTLKRGGFAQWSIPEAEADQSAKSRMSGGLTTRHEAEQAGRGLQRRSLSKTGVKGA